MKYTIVTVLSTYLDRRYDLMAAVLLDKYI